MNTDPGRADVTTAVAEQLARGLAAGDRLERFAVGMTSPWGGRELGDEPQADMLLVALFTRSYATFSADVELVRLGFGEQAAMLNRSLFEDMVAAHWIATYPDAAVELMRDHHMHGRMLLADAAAKYPSFYGDLEVPKFDPEKRKRLDGVFGKFGYKSWTRLNLHERVTQIEHFWESSDEALEALRFYRDIPSPRARITRPCTSPHSPSPRPSAAAFRTT